MVSKAEILISFLKPFMIILVQYILFKAIYKGGRQNIGGFSFSEIISYILLSGLVFSFADTGSLPYEMEDLTLSGKFVVTYSLPLNFFLYMLSASMGKNVTKFLPFLFLNIVVQPFLKNTIAASSIPLFIILIFLSFLTNFALYFMVSVLLFRKKRINGITEIFRFLYDTTSGRLFPLSFLPSTIGSALAIFPFAISVYLPLKFILRKPFTLIELGLSFIYPVILCILAIYLFNKEVKKYEAFGG